MGTRDERKRRGLQVPDITDATLSDPLTPTCAARPGQNLLGSAVSLRIPVLSSCGQAPRAQVVVGEPWLVPQVQAWGGPQTSLQPTGPVLRNCTCPGSVTLFWGKENLFCAQGSPGPQGQTRKTTARSWLPSLRRQPSHTQADRFPWADRFPEALIGAWEKVWGWVTAHAQV